LLPARGNDLLPYAADSQHLAGEGQLAGHRYALFWLLVARQREQGAGHADAGAGAVLGRGTFRYVQVHEGLIEEHRVAAVLLEVRADVAVGELGRLLHHLAELTGELEATVKGVDARGFDGQRDAAHAGPCQSGDDADALQALLAPEHRNTERFFQILWADADGQLGILKQAHHRLAHQLAELLLQLTHASLT